jgi:hypothetical protein
MSINSIMHDYDESIVFSHACQYYHSEIKPCGHMVAVDSLSDNVQPTCMIVWNGMIGEFSRHFSNVSRAASSTAFFSSFLKLNLE